jgi:predicted dehydrogenase
MEGKTIRIGIVGAGANTRAMHIPKLRAIEGVEILGVCNRSRTSGEAVAGELGIPRVYSRWEDLVSDRELDAVVIGTWPYMHCPVTIAALEAGKHVLCEARMAMDASEARRMLNASRSHPDLVAQLVPAPYTLELDQEVRDRIREGYTGRLLAIDVRAVSGAFIDQSSPLHWRQDTRLSGVNTLALGIWYEAVARWVGHARSVCAMSRVFVPTRIDPSTGKPEAVRVPDHVDALADMECGAQMRMQLSAATGLAPSTAEVWLFGADGTLRVEATGKKVFGGRRGDPSLVEIPVAREKRVGWRVEEEFVAAIRGREKVRLTSFEEGVRYMEFTEAVALSSSQGARISLPLSPTVSAL